MDVSMELRTEKVYTEEKKGPATTQLTFDETYHLPDYLPDFFSVILSRGQIRMDETKCSQGHVQVQGTLQFRVLYRTGQNEWNICSLEGEIPFHEMMTLDEAKEFDMAQTEAILETARACHDAGITTLAFTGNEDSELAKTADAIFTIHDDHPMDLKNVKPNCFTGSCILAFEELLSICLDNLKQEGLAP